MQKRTLSLLIILSMLVGMVVMPTNTFATDIEVDINNSSKLLLDDSTDSGSMEGTVPFEYTITPTNEIKASFEDVYYEKDVDFILAAYDGEELIGVKKTELEAGKNHSFDVTLSLSRLTDNLIVRCFIWSADGKYTPMTESWVGTRVYKNTLTFPSSDFIEYIAPNIIKYESAESAREIYYQLSEACELYVNGVMVEVWDEEIINQYLSYKNTDINLEDISNTKEGFDNKYDKVYVNYYADAVVDSVCVDDSGVKIYFKDSTIGEPRLRYENESIDVKFIKNGEEISVEDLKEYDVLSIMYDVYNGWDLSEFYTAYVEDKSVSGAVTGIDEGKNSMYINGIEYQCEDYLWAGDFEIGGNYSLYLNKFGNVVYIEENASSKMYGVIVGMYESYSYDYPVVRMITDNGELVLYECKNYSVADDFKTVIMNAGISSYDSTYLSKSDLTSYNIGKLVVEYKLTGEKISDISSVSSANYVMHLEYKESISKFGSYRVNEYTKFVYIEDYLNGGNEIYTLTLDDFEDEAEYEMYMCGKNSNTGDYEFGLVLGGMNVVKAETEWAIVKSSTSCIYEDENCYKLEVLKFDEKQNTETETVYVLCDAVWEKPNEGDIVMYKVGFKEYVEEGYFYTVINAFEDYDSLYKDSTQYDNFSDIINQDVLYDLVENSNGDVEYIFGPVYQSSGSTIEVITSQSNGVSNTCSEIEDLPIGDDVKSYICDYSKRGTYRFYRGDVPRANKIIFRQAMQDWEDELIDWSMVEQEYICPNFALLKVVDGDVIEIVTYIAE